MTEMPELIALLHSFVGLAAVLVGFNSYIEPGNVSHDMHTIHLVEVYLGIFIGAVTFTGSLVAFGKLNGKISSAPLQLPAKHKLNLAALVLSFILMLVFVSVDGSGFILILMTLIALAFGWHLVASIGGADMPVVVSMLNSYSGWAAAAAGFMLSNDLLIVTGALVGSSGAILSYIMCKAMNRSFISVIAGGFGTDGSSAAADGEEIGEYREAKPAEVAEMLRNASSVIITPGYGMAVAQAQYPVAEITELLRKNGAEVRFGIHRRRPPARSYERIARRSQSPLRHRVGNGRNQRRLPETDVVLVIGANDTVNPAAQTDPNSPIAGMPVLEVWKAKEVVVFKRSMNTGYAGVQNPLFFNENSVMCFGDAKKTVDEILAELKK